jgi:energy-coupling factor transporter ATP-binding protein EcfA2
MIYQGVTKPQVTSHPQLKSAVKTLFNWYNEGAPYSLIIAGNPGSGKSTMLRAMQMMIGGKFRTEYDLLNAYSQTRAEAIQQIKGNGLIFLDDVGVEKIPPFVKQQDEKIDDYFHGFYTVLFDYHGEPNRYTRFCISTNLDVDAFFRRIGDRASSRIQGLIGSKDHFIRLFDVPNFRAEGWIKS